MTNSVNGSPIITDDPTSKKAATVRIIKLAVAVAISAFLWLAPQTMFGIPNLSIVEQRVIAIFVCGA